MKTIQNFLLSLFLLTTPAIAMTSDNSPPKEDALSEDPAPKTKLSKKSHPKKRIRYQGSSNSESSEEGDDLPSKNETTSNASWFSNPREVEDITEALRILGLDDESQMTLFQAASFIIKTKSPGEKEKIDWAD